MTRVALLLTALILSVLSISCRMQSEPVQPPAEETAARPCVIDLDHLTSPGLPPVIAGKETSDPLPPEDPSSVPVHQRDLMNGRLGGPASAERLAEIGDRLSVLQSPVPGAPLPDHQIYMPGSPRTYRNGVHDGVDFYDRVSYGAPVLAAGSGVVIRADHDYTEPDPATRNRWLAIAAREAETPPDILDRLHGRQLWIDHGDGVITRYSHLESVARQVGDTVEAGDVIGTVGNSGIAAAAEGRTTGAHLHFEIHLDCIPFWDGLDPGQVRKLLSMVVSRP